MAEWWRGKAASAPPVTALPPACGWSPFSSKAGEDNGHPAALPGTLTPIDCRYRFTLRAA